MATARHLPREFTSQPITFTYNGSSLTVSSEAVIISSGSDVNFANSPNSTAPIGIAFAANPTGVPNPPGPVLFSNMTLAPGVNEDQQTNPNINGSVNYFVTAGGNTYGPFAIQVGSGPMYIQITTGVSNPDPIVVPKGGTLSIYSNDSNTYTIFFTSLNPFPGLTQAAPGWSNNSAYPQQGPARGYAYTFSVKTAANPGGGTIKVG